jgi:hypothetical protein
MRLAWKHTPYGPARILSSPEELKKQNTLMPKATMSFEKSRRHLLTRMSATAGRNVEKVITFRNEDVPKFLKQLDRFEIRSAKRRLVAK